MQTIQNPEIVHKDILSEKLQDYLKNKFSESKKCNESKDESGKNNLFWGTYGITGLAKANVFQFLKACFPQLCFPIRKGISESSQYRNATRMGIVDEMSMRNNDLQLFEEQSVTFSLYKSFAGDIPVLIVPDENDFIKIIQAILYKNHPVIIPPTMGAAFIKGINNWKRIHNLKADYLSKNMAPDWNRHFKENVVPYPDLYKDDIIILSTKPYSGICSIDIGLTHNEWLALSLKIRLEHECAHLYTFKHYGSASNNLHDELIADYVGIVRSLGKFNKDWMLSFLGLEDFPGYRNGSRLENYVKDISVETNDFSILTTLIKYAIENIYRFDVELGTVKSPHELERRINTLCQVDLADIGSEEGARLLVDKYLSGNK